MNVLIGEEDITDMAWLFIRGAEKYLDEDTFKTVTHKKNLTTIFGVLTNLAVNSGYRGGSCFSYSFGVQELVEARLGLGMDSSNLDFLLNELFISIRNLITRHLDPGALYDVNIIRSNNQTAMMRTYDTGFIEFQGISVSLLVSDRVPELYGDLISTDALVDWVKNRDY